MHPEPPVNSPYPYALWITLSREAPAAASARAMTSAQTSRSFAV
ncbi:hypothetical protein ACFQV2_06135 [Actinokineospora soli]|uniref:Uncharacterized protein n=1 Tax=Actinokineospora soli TaxID=1048753 RepID=A0ABW2TIL7_9PSEU